jgi:hypothetical protein
MTAISQEAQQIGPFAWTAGDPVSLAWRVNADWSGDYKSQIRTGRAPDATMVGEFTVTADYDAIEETTLFVMELTESESELILAGKYFCDVQQVNGVTRVWGQVIVSKQVTV